MLLLFKAEILGFIYCGTFYYETY